MKTVGYIVAAILVFFGVIFIWGAFSANGQPSYLIIGILTALIGLAIIYFVGRKPKVETTNVTLKVDLPGNVNMDSLKCKSCGGVLTAENIKVVNGAPMVTCPYCHTVYQITEEPKW